MGNLLTLEKMEEYVFHNAPVTVSKEQLKKVSDSYKFLVEFSKDKIIYGINTGFGPMAQYKIEFHELKKLQYNLIRSHSCGMGKPIGEIYSRSVMVARLNNFLLGNSGVNPEVILRLKDFLNKDITPEIFEHGGVGASGDLVQLAHLGLNLIGEGHVYFKGKRQKSGELLRKLGIKKLDLKLRDGLAIMNGTSCMTGIASVNLIFAYRLLNLAMASSAIINELVEAFDDSFSEGLNKVKRHQGQQTVARNMRDFLVGSSLIRSRKELFSDENELRRSQFKNKIQEYYSIRCVPQILGPVLDTLDYARNVVENEINSANDNPVVLSEDDNVFHGGNFHGDYISFEMDKVKLAMTKLSMLAERQLNFLLNHQLNKKFPPFLNGKKPGFNYGLQGLQFTATSTTAENQTLSNSMYVHSIPNNHDNQDIVSMGTNSAVMTRQVIDNGFQVMSVLLLGIAQAIDLLGSGEKNKLSPSTRKLHQKIRTVSEPIKEDIAQAETLELVQQLIRNKGILS